MNRLQAVALVFCVSFSLHAQEGHGVTPADIQRGGEIFLSKCANCHGPNGDAIPGVNLGSNHFRRAQTDRELVAILKNGIAGTAMPPGNYTDQQAAAIVAYLHSMPTATRRVRVSTLVGDAARGKELVEGKGQCLNCHRIGSAGSITGPDLTAIGSMRRPDDLELSLLDPNAEIRMENRTVRAVAKDGTPITGRLLNQDTYSLQILDSHSRLVSLHKDRLREFEVMKTSPMPGYKDKLSEQEVADTVAYLLTLKGSQ